VTLAEFKQACATVYAKALAHYKGDKVKARACVEAYCAGLNGAIPRQNERR